MSTFNSQCKRQYVFHYIFITTSVCEYSINIDRSRDQSCLYYQTMNNISEGTKCEHINQKESKTILSNLTKIKLFKQLTQLPRI